VGTEACDLRSYIRYVMLCYVVNTQRDIDVTLLNIYIGLAQIVAGRIWGAGVWVTMRDRQKRKGEI